MKIFGINLRIDLIISATIGGIIGELLARIFKFMI